MRDNEDNACPIDCSGGCPICAPDEHEEACVEEFRAQKDRCRCDVDYKGGNEVENS